MNPPTLWGAGLMLAPLPVARPFPRTTWPAHVTVLPNVHCPAGLDELVGTVAGIAGETAAVELVVGAEDRFGPDRDVAVRIVTGDGLRALHDRLLDAVERLGGAVAERPEWTRDGWRPHVSTVPGSPGPGRVRAGRLLLARLDGPAALPVAAFPLGVQAAAAASAERAAATWLRLRDAGVRSWVIGGWGVDALVGRATRQHHDLDLFVLHDDLPALLELADVRFLWSEHRFVAGLPTAFVADVAGVEVDVHTVALSGAAVVPLSAHTIELPPGALDAVGTIAGVEVRCATAAAQRVMHTGYELPAKQRADLAHLRALR